MFISEKMEKALSDQVNAEVASAYLYASMAAWLDANDLPGCAHWMKKQAEEELEHAEKIYDFVYDRGGKITYAAIEAPQTEWENVLKLFEHVLSHEQKVTGLIYGLVDLAIELKDHATKNMLNWFLEEQVEEEKNASEVLSKFKHMGTSGIALSHIDKDLGAREE